MILNLSKSNGERPAQNNLMSNQNFLLKNKITVNSVAKAHYTVEGVQIYSPAEIQSLKQAQQRTKNTENKQPVEVKVYQIADYFDQFQEAKSLNPKQKVQQLLKTKYNKDLGKSNIQNRSQNFIEKDELKMGNNLSVKQKMIKNNVAVSKLQKQRKKKDIIQKKLAQLSKHYKQHFKKSQNQQQNQEERQNVDNQQQNISLTESILKINNKKNNHKGNQQQQQSQQIISDGREQEQQQSVRNQKSLFNKKQPKSYVASKNEKSQSDASTYCTKDNLKTKSNKKSNKIPNKGPESRDQDGQFEDVQQGLDLIGEIVNNRSTYSQKLGSAVHMLFN